MRSEQDEEWHEIKRALFFLFGFRSIQLKYPYMKLTHFVIMDKGMQITVMADLNAKTNFPIIVKQQRMNNSI